MGNTVKASPEGLERVDRARIRKKWRKQEKAWADLAQTSVSTLKRFLGGEAIQADIFENLCKAVGIDDWESIADLTLEEMPAGKGGDLIEENRLLPDEMHPDFIKLTEREIEDNYIMLEGNLEIITIEEAQWRFRVSPIIERFGTWAVTTYGVECLVRSYSIEWERVNDRDWPEQMSRPWVKFNDFINAWVHAQEIYSIRRQYFSKSDSKLEVCLCHEHEGTIDIKVKKLFYKLKGIGVAPWVDEEKLLAGQDRRSEIAKRISVSDVLVVCLTEKSTDKNGCLNENIQYALDRLNEKPEDSIWVIPAKLEPCIVPDRLKGKKSVELFTKKGFDLTEKGFDLLLRSLILCFGHKRKNQRNNESSLF